MKIKRNKAVLCTEKGEDFVCMKVRLFPPVTSNKDGKTKEAIQRYWGSVFLTTRASDRKQHYIGGGSYEMNT